MEGTNVKANIPNVSFSRRRESIWRLSTWMPVSTGMTTLLTLSIVALVFAYSEPGHADEPKKLTPSEIITILKSKVNSTGNIADAVEEATGQRGFMTHDMKPIFKTKIVGRRQPCCVRCCALINAPTATTRWKFLTRLRRKAYWCTCWKTASKSPAWVI